jgi:hypothetical protein
MSTGCLFVGIVIFTLALIVGFTMGKGKPDNTKE